MAKFENIVSVVRTESGKRYFTSAIPREPTIAENANEYTARIGDRWDSVASRFLGSPTFWYALAIANNSVNGSIFIKPGTTIKIPEV